MCERCKDQDKTDVRTYTIHKGNASRATTLCGECATITRNAGFKLSGGKATEVETPPPAPEPEEAAAEETTSEPEAEPTQDEPPARPSRRR